MMGRVSSVQSLGAVDGPGLRYVVFMQGCPLRCAYCHNPETWERQGGEEISSRELADKILRFRPYFGERGGVTVSGGEPLLQPEFVEELFALLRREGLHTALDTSGAGNLEQARKVLAQTDLVLADLKFPTEAGYRAHCGGSLAHTEAFLRLTEELGVPLWVRHVVVPGLTDSPESLRAIWEKAHGYSNLEKLEWLPFHNLCAEKYETAGLAFPLRGTPALSRPELEACLRAAEIAQE